jgi:transposase
MSFQKLFLKPRKRRDHMKEISILGIDLAKHNYQIYGINQKQEEIVNKRLSRNRLIEFVTNLKPCLVAMEACSGAHYLGRNFQELGHDVKLLPPQYVKPFVFTNKDDEADARAITEASTKKAIHPVPIKETMHQDIQFIHKLRVRFIKEKNALSNEIRSMLFEYGIVISRGDQVLNKRMRELISSDRLSSIAKESLIILFKEFHGAVKNIAEQEKRLREVAKKTPLCKKLLQIPGVGLVTATALVASVPDPNVFKNGRAFSAWLGLVPKHTGTGGKNKNLSMSKRGDQYLRYLLIHGARAVLRTTKNKSDPLSSWCNALIERRGYNKACVALANKNARIIWAIMKTGQEYKAIQ